MVVATRRRRKLDGRQLNSFKIFTIAEDPCTVLGYLRAVDVAHVAASCAGAAKLCLDDKVLERVAAQPRPRVARTLLRTVHDHADLVPLVRTCPRNPSPHGGNATASATCDRHRASSYARRQ